MQKSVVVPVRYPERIVEEIDALIEAGLYKCRSEALKDAARRLVREHYGLLHTVEKNKSSVQIVSEIRKKIWEKALKKAKGDEEKAAKLIAREAGKIKL